MTFENGLTGLNSTLELAKPANEVLLSEAHLAEEEHVALKMPIKIRLENPFLGESCCVGSSSSPILWELTTGATKPPAPNTSIKGALGTFEFLEEAQILKIKGNKLVDNAWAAPGANGCGGIFYFILDPIINAAAGLPATAGHNTAILKGTLYETTAFALKLNNEKIRR